MTAIASYRPSARGPHQPASAPGGVAGARGVAPVRRRVWMIRTRRSLAALAAAAGNGPTSVAIGDLNGDAMPDLTVDNRGAKT